MRYTVLTYIFDNYERVHEIAHKEDDVEYLLITDNPRLHSNTWTVCIDPTLDYLSTFDKCYRVRFHPFHYATTDTVVRIDGSIGIRGSLTPLVDAVIKGNYDRCLMIHPNRNNIEQEYDVWCRHRDYPLKQVGSQGQQRTFVLAMKLAQALYIGKPILLLDDIFDRLDSERVERIVEMVQGEEFGQIFITDTDREHHTEILKPSDSAKISHVENGVIQ